MIWYFIIYVIGYITLYWFLKHEAMYTKSTWIDVIIRIFLSLCSFAGLAFIAIVYSIIQLLKKFPKYPPKWL